MSRYRYYNPNPIKSDASDCVVRALCRVTGMPWQEQFLDLAEKSLELGDMPSVNTVWIAYLRDLGFAGVEQGANARQIANMQTAFDLSRQFSDCCCENRLATANLNATIASEACATRTTDTQNTQAILNAINTGVQSVKDQMCQDKIDSKNDEISALRQQIAMKDLAASQVAQNAFIAQGLNDEVDALYNRLSNCPVPTTPVYGRTPIFNCNNNGCGCGCGM